MKKNITDIMCKINHIIHIFSKIFTPLASIKKGYPWESAFAHEQSVRPKMKTAEALGARRSEAKLM